MDVTDGAEQSPLSKGWKLSTDEGLSSGDEDLGSTLRYVGISDMVRSKSQS